MVALSYERCVWWLVAINVFFALFGVAVAVLGDTLLFAIWNNAAADLFWDGTIPDNVAPFKRFMFGIVGGTIAGFHALMAFVAAIPLARRERWAVHALGASLLIWFAVDSLIGVLTGAWFNVLLINVFALLAIGVPLWLASTSLRSDVIDQERTTA